LGGVQLPALSGSEEALKPVPSFVYFSSKYTNNTFIVHNEEMPSKPPIVFPQEQTLLTALGERLRLARLRRKLSTAVVAQRAGMSRTSVYKVEAGDAGATLGTYLRVLAVLGLTADFNALAADDKVGRKLQDLALAPSPAQRRQRRASVQTIAPTHSTPELLP
jgi:transcriptional regulator with XRE-family HTH domain